ncbi:MAG: hypothetical protein RIQ60_1817 [Pseudomonadota bacterium]|jgi:exodeoxyribonuclease V beta subunit
MKNTAHRPAPTDPTRAVSADDPAGPAPAQPLDALSLPLWGSRLIEASAGTGKTWTIAALYLRLVLGHGDAASGHGRALLPAQILVMTFTRAATRELSDRIRARLVEAAACFRGQRAPAPGDHLLHELMAAYPAGAARELAAWRLAGAAEAMDDAAVHTIDAWCQRMLREHAFDSGSLFDEELQANPAALFAQACRDYWRQQVYPITEPALLDRVMAVWPDVETLERDAAALQPHVAPEWLGALSPDGGAGEPAPPSLGELLQRRLAEQRATLDQLKSGWDGHVETLADWLAAQLAGKAPVLKKAVYKSNWVADWLQALRVWVATPAQALPGLSASAWSKLSSSGLRDARHDPQAGLAVPPQFDALHALKAQWEAQEPVPDAVRRHAAAHIAARVAQLKRSAGRFGFADMLQRLDRALGSADDAGERLRRRIVEQYPVALVDEFQDTSPLQYRIFDRLYATAANAPGQALFLIGDPKQSIYAFRGADIHSYMAARQATRGRHYLLDTNYRSTAPLVAAVNELFKQAERRAGRGAFLFRGQAADGAPLDPLPYTAVQARGRAERLLTHEGELAALTLSVDAQLQSAGAIRRRDAQRCAEHIVGLLNDEQAGFAATAATAVVQTAGSRPRPPLQRLRPGDIAVLVRSGHEAAQVRKALDERGVRSVYLSDKESVYASREAADLLLWLQAVADPLDSRRARAALATPTVGLALAELARLSQDDLAFEQRVEQLRALASVWRRQGVLPMLRRTLHELELPARWLARPDGERRLTNVLHLAELLQAASATLDGEHALIRWLASQIADPAAAAAGDDQIVRLESDADLVQVITVHKSKGLEYPLVYLPFATSYRAVSKKGRSFVALAGDQAGERRLDFRLSDDSLAAADDERLQEDLRLLYVALTRARHAVWLGVGLPGLPKSGTSQLHLSALGRLLKGGAVITPAELTGLLQTALAGAGSAVDLRDATPMGELGRTPLAARASGPALHAAPVYAAAFARDWGIASFSALVRDLRDLHERRAMQAAQDAYAGHAAHAAPAGPEPVLDTTRHLLADAALHEELLAEAGDEPADDLPAAHVDAVMDNSTAAPQDLRVEVDAQPWHGFARGALAGNFLHEQLEWLAEHRFALDTHTELQRELLRRCERSGWGHRAQAVLSWLRAVLTTPLPVVGAPLAGLAGALLPEMEFWLASERGANAAGIDLLCRRHLLDRVPRPDLPERQLRGMLMGFADLVFESGGRYWVLDYKSNALGDDDAGYTAEALRDAMAAHRYDVQAALYLLALHRLLRLRLGERYDPAQHLGGAVYLFLRGIRGPESGCCVIQPDATLLDALDQQLAGTSLQDTTP